jgi:hypothetical protein
MDFLIPHSTYSKKKSFPLIIEESMCTVKAGNFVTFFAQINFFLKNALR